MEASEREVDALHHARQLGLIMESPPAGPGRNLIMTRSGAIGLAVGLVCMAFVCGCFFSALYIETSTKRRLATQEVQVKQIAERTFVPMFVDATGMPVSDEEGLRNFRLTSQDLVSWSFVGGVEKEKRIEVSGSGAVTLFDDAGTKQITTLDDRRCAEFFRKIIAGGLAGYSEEALQLKRDLSFDFGMMYPQFVPTARPGRKIRIYIPQLGVDREFSIQEPDFEHGTYPNIIEYRSAVEIEKEILSFIP